MHTMPKPTMIGSGFSSFAEEPLFTRTNCVVVDGAAKKSRDDTHLDKFKPKPFIGGGDKFKLEVAWTEKAEPAGAERWSSAKERCKRKI